MTASADSPRMLLRRIALVAVLFAAGPYPARAGETIAAPFTELPCRDPQDVLGELADPNGLYAVAANCPAECRRAERDCEQYAKLANSCMQSALNLPVDLPALRLSRRVARRS
jgi:hypothetical protein